ncbi:MAG: 4a-hydroxytetrahydrobiopterin dehydratase [Woeseiaceae bacterium]|nr:4a-hydroxytetrahydrobiopterin dehydratase [Woeseiaceae bacterium]
MANKLNDEAVQDRLSDLEGWTLDEGKLFRAFKFANFVEAIGFMTRAAIEAEKMDHHPEWFNVYSKVNVHLTTHSAGGITELDFALAKIMDELAK